MNLLKDMPESKAKACFYILGIGVAIIIGIFVLYIGYTNV